MSKKQDNNSSFFSWVIYFVVIYMCFNYFNSVKNQVPNSNYEYKSYASILKDQENLDDLVNELKNEYNIEFSDDLIDELLFMNSVKSNNNLDNSDKKVFYGFYSIVKDLQEMDRERAYNSLSKVKVNRTERGDYSSSNTLGDYAAVINNINIYETDLDNMILVHEGIHCMFNNNSNETLPRYFNEGMTELLSKEYFSNDPFFEGNSYPYEVSYVKMLCELLGTDTVLSAFTSGDYNIILSAMDKGNKSNYSSYKILDIYEDSFDIVENKSTSSKYSDEERWNAYEYVKDIYTNLHPNPYNFKDFNYLYELSASVFEEEPGQFFSDYVYFYGVLQKSYFSSDLKKDFPTSTYPKYENRSIIESKGKKIVNLTN